MEALTQLHIRMFTACRQGKIARVRDVLNTKILFFSRFPNIDLKRNGMTPLMTAAKYGHRDIAQLLIEKGANVNLPNCSGETSLCVAAIYGQADMVSLLLDEGAEIDIQTDQGFTALIAAAEKGHLSVVNILLQWGADETIETDNGSTAVQVATTDDIKSRLALAVPHEAVTEVSLTDLQGIVEKLISKEAQPALAQKPKASVAIVDEQSFSTSDSQAKSVEGSAMLYMEVSGNDKNPAQCSDNECPCGNPGASIFPGEGYFFTSQAVVDFRHDCLSEEEALEKVNQIAVTGKLPDNIAGQFVSILMCRLGAEKRGLDLAVATEDAKYWWHKGKIPLRVTPLAASLNLSSQSYAEQFTNQIKAHLKQIGDLGGLYEKFIEEHFSDDIVAMLAGAAEQKMTLTEFDLNEHSCSMSKSPVSYWICTLPYSVTEAKNWFGEAYGGYSKLLENAWGSDHFVSANCEVLVHIVFSQTVDGVWLNMTIFPINSQQFSFQPILPIDLLTDQEKTI